MSERAEPNSSPAGPAQPYAITDCQAAPTNYGDSKALPERVASAVAAIGKTLCYGYWELEPNRVESSVKACVTQAHSPTVKSRIPKPEGGCEVQVLTAKHRERRWVWVRSLYVRGGEVGDQQDNGRKKARAPRRRAEVER